MVRTARTGADETADGTAGAGQVTAKTNSWLTAAKANKQDEFYTQLSDVENELRHFRKHFKNKVVLCNCDDPFESDFFKYFVINFRRLGLKKLIASCYGGSPVEHRLDPNANALWTYFKTVVDWAKLTFPTVRAPMKSVPWNELYEQFKDTTLDAAALEDEVKRLMQDAEVERKSGVYEYVLTGDERALGLRTFDNNMKREAYERQNGICPQCGEHFEYGEMDGDHILPWARGGTTTAENCQMLCVRDNRSKRR